MLSVGTADGSIRIFDIRTHAFVCGSRPFQSQGSISAITPVHTPNGEQLSVMSFDGVLKILEIRQSNQSVFSSLETQTTLRAHSSGCCSSLISHPRHPVMVSATLHPIVKVWTAHGEQVNAFRRFCDFIAD